MARQYAGVRVRWKGTLLTADKQTQDTIRLQMRVEDEAVFCNVNSAAHPGIGLLRRGDPVLVQGAIEDIHSIWITLSDARLIPTD
jgi:hypothetical protein